MTEHKQQETARWILAEQVDLQYRQSQSGLIATLAISALLVAGLWPVSEHRQLLAWYGLLCGASTFRFLLLRRYLASDAAKQNPEYWNRWFIAGVMTTALCWAVMATLLYPAHSDIHQLLVILVLAGFSASAVALLSYVPYVYLCYMLPVMLPLTLTVYRNGGHYHYIALMLCVFMILVWISSRRFLATVHESLAFKFEREGLVATLSREVQERLQRERELRDINLFQDKIMENTTNAIFVVDQNGLITRSNHVLANITGRSTESLTGLPLMALFAGSDREQLREPLRELLQGESPLFHQVFSIHRPNGVERIIDISLTPLREQATVAALVGTIDDITDRTRADRYKNEFLSTISHELRTPLTSISGSLALVDGGISGDIPDKAKQLIGMARRNCERLLHLINELLDLQKLESGELKLEFDNHDLLQLLEHALEASRGLEIRHQVQFRLAGAEHTGAIRVDARRFEQIILNLLSNAAKFSRAGEPVDIQLQARGDRLRVAVSDSGPGIPEEFRERIFTRFAQADGSDQKRTGGTGLGLSICKALTRNMGGDIGFESTVGQGSTFWVDFARVAGA